MSLESRIESLKGRHASLEMRITDEDSRPRPDGDALRAQTREAAAEGGAGAPASSH